MLSVKRGKNSSKHCSNEGAASLFPQYVLFPGHFSLPLLPPLPVGAGKPRSRGLAEHRVGAPGCIENCLQSRGVGSVSQVQVSETGRSELSPPAFLEKVEHTGAVVTVPALGR